MLSCAIRASAGAVGFCTVWGFTGHVELSAVSFQLSVGGATGLTIWQLLGVVRSGVLSRRTFFWSQSDVVWVTEVHRIRDPGPGMDGGNGSSLSFRQAVCDGGRRELLSHESDQCAAGGTDWTFAATGAASTRRSSSDRDGAFGRVAVRSRWIEAVLLGCARWVAGTTSRY
jgi:hypothetical protein